jgi:plasmid maintenance system antidote protein VapI
LKRFRSKKQAARQLCNTRASISPDDGQTHAIVNGMRDIAADTDLRPCKFFGPSDGYFLRLQNAYDTLEAKRKIAREVPRIKRCKPDKAAQRTER